MLSKLPRAFSLSTHLLAFASAAHAQIMGPAVAMPAPAGPTVTERVAGTVLNSVTHQPVAGVLVTSPGRPLAVLTDSEGHFPFDLTRPADPGSGSVQTSLPLVFQLRKPGYLSRAAIVSAPYSSNTPASSVELSITPASAITGRIETDSVPLSQPARVVLFHRQVVNGAASWLRGQSVQANSRGEYRFFELSPGSYKVAALSSEAETPRQSSAPSLPGFLPAFPNADTFEASSPIRIRPGETATANLTLRSAAFYRVVVPVALPASPPRTGSRNGPAGPPGVEVSLLPDPFGFEIHYDPRSGAAIGYLPPGTYRLHLLAPGNPPASASIQFNVGQAPLTATTVALQPAAQVPVSVRWDSPSTAVAQQYNFSFEPVEPGVPFAGDRSRTSSSPFSTVQLPEGLYRFVMNIGHGYVASATSGNIDLLREPLPVVAGESPQPIQVSLRDDVASLRVTVVSTTGSLAETFRPEQIALIACVPLDQFSRATSSVALLVSSASFAFSNLAPGRYLVLASPQEAQFRFDIEYRNPDALAQLMSKGTIVTLSPNQQASVQVPLVQLEDE